MGCSTNIEKSTYKGVETNKKVAESNLAQEDKTLFNKAFSRKGAEKLKDQTIESIISNEKERQNTINKIIELLDKNIESVDDGRSTGKFIEDAWKLSSDDEELSALYHYDTTLFWIGIDESENAKNAIRKISPDYKGVYSSKIFSLGTKLFGSKENWEKQYQIAGGIKKRTEERQKSGDKTFEKNVIKYMEERYAYYDQNKGKQDKYSDIVFNETAKQFSITKEEVDVIWADPENHKLVNIENQESFVTSDNQENNYKYNPDAISLYMGGEDIIVGITDRALSDAINCLVKKDDFGFNELVSNPMCTL